MIRADLFTTLVALLVAACGSSSTPSTKKPTEPPETVRPDDEVASRAQCDAGNWVPNAQEPAHYVSCTENRECVKMVLDGCCSQTFIPIRRDRVCGTDLGSTCEMECTRINISPKGAESMHAECVANKCTLVD